jgi:hypothetical protein
VSPCRCNGGGGGNYGERKIRKNKIMREKPKVKKEEGRKGKERTK